MLSSSEEKTDTLKTDTTDTVDLKTDTTDTTDLKTDTTVLKTDTTDLNQSQSKPEADTNENSSNSHSTSLSSGQTNDSEENRVTEDPQTEQGGNRLKSFGKSLGEHTKKASDGIIEGVKNINEKHRISGKFSDGARQISGRFSEGAKQVRASVSASQVGSSVKKLNEEHKVTERVSDGAKRLGSSVKGFNANIRGRFSNASSTIGNWRLGKGSSKADPAPTADDDDDQSV